jgi:two-component system invasion response regulator UvrY
MIRVLLVDDHELVRTGFRRLLEETDDVEVVGEAGTGEEGTGLAMATKPDVVIMDINMPGIGGLEATRRILRMLPETRVIALSVHRDGLFPRRLMEAGAAGYLTKTAHFGELLEAIRTVSEGHPYLSREVAETVALEAVSGVRHAVDGLTDRELEIMRMVGQGLSIQDISDRLFISPKTVSAHRSKIFKKLGVHSDVELTHLSISLGMIETT